MQTKTKNHWLPLLVVILLYSVVVAYTVKWSFAQELDKLSETASHQLNLYVAHLKGQLEKYESLPEMLSTNKTLVDLLKRPGDRNREQALNEYLETINDIANAADTYLMDADGLTIAASNWSSERPFIGRNFSYRPYFQQAMKGQLGRYFALGSTSQKRGYYFAFPVRYQQQILGAMVVKVDLSDMESQWKGRKEKIAVTDPNGIVFITTESQWRYRTFQNLSEETLQRVIASNRYPDTDLEKAPLLKTSSQLSEGRLVTVDELSSGSRYLMLDQFMPEAGWNVHLFISTKDASRQSIMSGVIVFSILTIIALFGLYVRQRQRRQEEQIQCETQAREVLRKSHDELEQRVQDRTAELRNAQDELIQAAKLAVIGQISAGISHELNQPLTAIRTYADNARLLLDHERQDDARDNLKQIATLTERMAQISSQLKLFARKTDGELTPVSVIGAWETTKNILQPQLKKTQTKLIEEMDLDNTQVVANTVQLEQVLVNLLGNAMQAMESQALKEVSVLTEVAGKDLVIQVRDRGPGISDENIEKIFDPFFTTRKKGLGLGLAISQRIVKSMGGTLTAANHPQGGAVFTVTLSLHKP